MKEANEKVVSAPDFSAVKPEHVGKWVVLSSNYKKLLAVGGSLNEALTVAGNLPNKVVVKVLPNLGYAPNAN